MASSAAGFFLCSATKRALCTNMPPEPQAGSRMRPWNGSMHFDEQADDAARRVELAALLALGAGELAEEVFVDAPEGVVVQRWRESRRPS